MILDDKKIEGLIEKEIKEQVAKKINAIPKKNLLKLYEDCIYNAISSKLEETQEEFIDSFKQELVKNKEDFQKEIISSVSNKFIDSLKNAFIKEDRLEDYTDEFDLDY